MARFSIGAAIGEAFGLIRRRPLAVFIWGLLLMAPSIASMVVLLPVMGEMVAAMPEDGVGRSATSDAAFAHMMQLQGLSMLLNLVQLAMVVVVYSAIMRAVLHPVETRLFSLRVGMDELRVAVVGVAMIVGCYAIMLVMLLVGGALAFATWGLGSPLNWIIIGLLVAALFAAIWVGAARVSLIAPASVLYRSFAFPEGWRLARGQTGPLFGMMVLLLLIILVIEAAVVVAGVGVWSGLKAGSGLNWPASGADANPFPELGAFLAANWPWLALVVLAVSMFYGVVLTLGIAPFASACRQLAADSAPASAKI